MLYSSHFARFLFSGSRDGSIRKWDLNTFEASHVVNSAHKGGVKSIRINDETLFSCGMESVVKRFNTVDLMEIRPFFKHSGIVCDIDVDTAGSLLVASGADGNVKVYAITPGGAECIRTFVEHEDILRAPAKSKRLSNASSVAVPVTVVRIFHEIVLSSSSRNILVRVINSF